MELKRLVFGLMNFWKICWDCLWWWLFCCWL